jgi:DNA-binding PadR family transcriptional regulator
MSVRTTTDHLLLGEWACLGVVAATPTHGFAVAARLRPDGDIGRIWSLSRALTYRSLDQLAQRDYVRRLGVEPGIAGGMRTILTATPAGRRALRAWLNRPVEHLRDLRTELLLKLTLAELAQIDTTAMLAAQHDRVAAMATTLTAQCSNDRDLVALWRAESSCAALRFLERLGPGRRVDG